MKFLKLTLLIGILSFASKAKSQSELNNALSTSLFRVESNSQTMNHNYANKFVTGVEYQRFFGDWALGVALEHGYNKVDDRCFNCYDAYNGTGYLKESSVFLRANYAFVRLFKSKVVFNAGAGIYYSNINYSGLFDGGFSGERKDIRNQYDLFGISPELSIQYFPTERFFISLNSNIKVGYGMVDVEKVSLVSEENYISDGAFKPIEFKVGVRF
jgi:hypothetical protein